MKKQTDGNGYGGGELKKAKQNQVFRDTAFYKIQHSEVVPYSGISVKNDKCEELV